MVKKGHRRSWKVKESQGKSRKIKEGHGRSWKVFSHHYIDISGEKRYVWGGISPSPFRHCPKL